MKLNSHDLRRGLRRLLTGGLALGLACTTALADGENHMINRQSHNTGIPVLPAPDQVNIDGKLSEWDLSGQIWSFVDVAVRDRFSARTAAMWDQEAIYVSVDWADPVPMNNLINPATDPNDGWKGDAVQLRFLAGEPGSPVMHVTAWNYTPGDQPVVSLTRHRAGAHASAYAADPGGTQITRGIEMAFSKRADGTGYVQEIKIPWDVIFEEKPAIEPGMPLRMGMEFMWGGPKGDWPIHRYADNLQPDSTKRNFYWSNWKAWGNAMVLAEGDITPRTYVPEGQAPEGTIPVRVSIPASAARFTLAIETPDGQRVRNLAGDFSVSDYKVKDDGDQRVVEVMWNGLDDDGQLVEPGTYNVRVLTHEGLGAEYDMSYYNPGSPPWDTTDGTGAWGADHTSPQLVAAHGQWATIAWPGAEGGSGIIAVGPDGQKRWGEKRGARAVAIDDDHVYAVTSGGHGSPPSLIRFAKTTGEYEQFELNEELRPFDLDLADLLQQQPTHAPAADSVAAQVVEKLKAGDKDTINETRWAHGLDVFGNRIVLATRAGVLAVLDAQTAELERLIDLPEAADVAFDDEGALLAISENAVYSLDLDTGERQKLQTPGVVEAVDLAIDSDGNVLVFDGGPDSQIKAYTRDGKPAYTAGTKGGRPRHGPFDEQAMIQVSSIAADDQGQIWAVEAWQYPRRVSLWGRDGKLIRDYVGNTGYAGSLNFLHDTDPNLAYIGPVEVELNHEDRTYDVKSILWVPDRSKNQMFQLWTWPHHFSNPGFHVSDASGEQRRYLVFLGRYREYYAIYMEREGSWVPVTAITQVGFLNKRAPELDTGDRSEKTGVLWHDQNNDAAVDQDELTFAEGELPADTYWTHSNVDSQLNLYFRSNDRESLARYRPQRFTDRGAPIYSIDHIEQIPLDSKSGGGADFIPLLDEDRVIALGSPDLLGVSLEEDSKGKTLWHYPSRYHGVHGSHKAPMTKPGDLSGALKILGIADMGQPVGKVFAIRTNLGQDHYFTTDGLYVGALFQDTRLPNPALPESEAALEGMPMEMFTNGGEPFSGYMTRHSDGVVRSTTSMARQAAMIVKIKGLESIRRHEGPGLQLDGQALAEAARANAERAQEEEGPRSYQISRVDKALPIKPSASEWKDVPSLKIESSASSFEGTAQIAYDQDTLYLRYDVEDPTPWLNQGRDYTRLFKTGDAVDLQIQTDPSAKADRRDPVAGDLRVVIASMNEKPTAVLMQPVAPDASEDQHHVYSSPVMDRPFDQVAILEDARVNVKTDGNRYVLVAAVPLESIGLKPESGQTVRGDVGFISSDAQGRINTARTYWSNQVTNLVNDLPQEAALTPQRWGELSFE